MLINIVYYVGPYTLTYISCNIHNCIPNQAINVAKSCFNLLCFFFKKIQHECGGHVTVTLTLSFNFWGTHTYKCPPLAFIDDNYRYLSYNYGIRIHVWNLPLCKLYKCFDLYLLNHHNMIANGVFIRDLYLLRENNIVVDDQDLLAPS